MAYNKDTNTITDPSGFTYTPSATGLANYQATQTTPITPESLAPAAVAPFAQPAPTALPDIASLAPVPDQTLTPQETQDQATTDRLTQISDQLVGKSADQATANETYGVNAAQKTITDLGARLTGLTNDANAIPLLLEQANSSKGITTVAFNGQKNQLLRENAIQALTVSSLMAAAQGQASNAQSLADKAVAAKYGPLEAEYDAKSRNLELIRNSPQYTLEQKNRAQKQQDILDKNKQAQDLQKQNAQEVNKIALDAASNGADAVTLDKISKAQTPIEAMQAASNFRRRQTDKALVANIPTPYGNSGGKIIDKSGYAYTSEGDFLQKTGMSIGQAEAKGLVTKVGATSDLKSGDTQIVTAGGREILVNKLTGEVIKDLGGAYKDSSGEGGGGGGTTKITEATSASKATQYLTSKKGTDQKVSPETWNAAMAAWKDDGHSAASFIDRFGNLVNKSYEGWKNNYLGF